MNYIVYIYIFLFLKISYLFSFKKICILQLAPHCFRTPFGINIGLYYDLINIASADTTHLNHKCKIPIDDDNNGQRKTSKMESVEMVIEHWLQIAKRHENGMVGRRKTGYRIEDRMGQRQKKSEFRIRSNRHYLHRSRLTTPLLPPRASPTISLELDG